MMLLTARELLEKKLVAEAAINTALYTFKKETGMKVRKIKMRFDEPKHISPRQFLGVSIKIEIEI